jgi:hypothetical protein
VPGFLELQLMQDNRSETVDRITPSGRKRGTLAHMRIPRDVEGRTEEWNIDSASCNCEGSGSQTVRNNEKDEFYLNSPKRRVTMAVVEISQFMTPTCDTHSTQCVTCCTENSPLTRPCVQAACVSQGSFRQTKTSSLAEPFLCSPEMFDHPL